MLNDIFINQQEIENELENMKEVAENFNTQFSLLSQKAAYIFSKIETSKTFEEANKYFEVLDIMQAGLACLLYKYNIGLPDRLLRFTHDFDNLEPIYRKRYFEKITSREYFF